MPKPGTYRIRLLTRRLETELKIADETLQELKEAGLDRKLVAKSRAGVVAAIESLPGVDVDAWGTRVPDLLRDDGKLGVAAPRGLQSSSTRATTVSRASTSFRGEA